eukprot:TRINITY_DN29405_c0_g1_i3.p1 TRINITY_DN29405_c0_g1~~TRINITY_DN29405_c0_g1_i3.p1  ORF type:complete len:360 (-),score=70.76 TRINITY_DN29405_c0_g1_i3:84-1163(-)
MGELEELAQFLNIETRFDVKLVALQHIVGLTGSKDGINAIREADSLHAGLMRLIKDPDLNISKEAAVAMINLSSDPSLAKNLLQSNQMTGLVKTLYECVKDEECKVADSAAMILSNLTRDRVSCDLVWQDLQQNDIQIERLVFILCQEKYNKHGANLRYLAPVLSNLSQLSDVRKHILDREQCVFQRFLPFTQYEGAMVKKGGAIGVIRNCCFDHDHHDWMLSEDVDLLPSLLLPLAGPSPDCFTDEEMDKLPMDLQYLDDSKKVEADPDIRKMLLESLLQLCATKSARQVLREKNAYLILRELHKTEKDREVLLALENIVDILIKSEEEINLENYKNVEVPGDLIEQFKKMDELYLKD